MIDEKVDDFSPKNLWNYFGERRGYSMPINNANLTYFLFSLFKPVKATLSRKGILYKGLYYIEFLHQNVDRYQMLVYQKLSEDERIMFCSYFRNEDIVVISGWNKTYGDLYVLNCSDTPMHFRSKVQDEYIDTNQILKVIVRNKDL